MSETPVERVARAIVAKMEEQQFGTESPWHDPEFRANAFECARAAIAVLLEPTEEMLRAGAMAYENTGGDPLADTIEAFDEAWHAGIDAALKQ